MSDLTDRAKAALDRLQGAIAKGATMFALEDIAPILNAYAAQPPGDLVRREECAQRLALFAELFAADDEGLALAPDVWNRLRSDLALAVRLLRAATPERGQGEPVAWVEVDSYGAYRAGFHETVNLLTEGGHQLYAAPPSPDEARALLVDADRALEEARTSSYPWKDGGFVTRTLDRIRAYLEKTTDKLPGTTA